jgi:hypothetical protein
MNDDVLELHPLAKLAFLSLTTTNGKTFEMHANARERIVRALERLFDKPDLRTAVVSLISLAKHVEDTGSAAAADVLLSIAATACSALKKQGKESAQLAHDLGEMTTKTFAAFSDRELVRAAPKHGEGVKGVRRVEQSGATTIAAINAAKRKIIR